MQYFLLPDAILADAARLYTDKAILVENGRVLGFAPRDGIPVNARRLVYPGELWVAAPVLAHAHLESFDAPSASWNRSAFSGWAECLLEWRSDPERLPTELAALHTLHELAGNGCGLVAAHVGEPRADGRAAFMGEEPPVLPEVTVMPELFAPDAADADALIDELDATPPRAGTGIALHAPFSVSEPLARGVFGRARGWAVPVSIHLGEHEEERAMLAGKANGLSKLFERRGQKSKTRTWASPVDWLDSVGGMQPGTMAVHGGDLQHDELVRLHEAGVAHVWCPGTHAYFERPLPAFAIDGLPAPALGCDSRASNESLDPLRELRLARATLPQFGPSAWWAALTAGGARALGRPDLGDLSPGKRARILRFSWEPGQNADELCDRLSADDGFRPLGPAQNAPFRPS